MRQLYRTNVLDKPFQTCYIKGVPNFYLTYSINLFPKPEDGGRLPAKTKMKGRQNMKILEQSREFNNQELYKFMYSEEVEPLSMIPDNKVVEVQDYLIIEKLDARSGELQNVLYMQIAGVVYATNSKVMIEKINTIIQLFDSVGKIKISRIKTKAGKYTTCEKVFE